MSAGGKVREIGAGAVLLLAGSVVGLAAPGAAAAMSAAPSPPTVSQTGPVSVTDNVASFTVTVNTYGQCGTAGEFGHDDTTGAPGASGAPELNPVVGDQTVTLTIGGLTPSDTYTSAATVVTDNCTDGGNVQTVTSNAITFTAAPGPAPTDVITGPANPVFNTEANVGGSFVGLGSPIPTFEYGTTTAYGSTAAVNLGEDAASDGSQPVQVRALISNLTPDTLYHYRLVLNDGHNPPVYGQDETFTTAPTTQLPVGAVGGLGFAALLALLLAWQLHRARRARRA